MPQTTRSISVDTVSSIAKLLLDRLEDLCAKICHLCCQLIDHLGVADRASRTDPGLKLIRLPCQDVALCLCHKAENAFVTDRLTNPQIADKLFLSKKTVESHIRNLFVKLGASSRVEVARIVERDRRERAGIPGAQ